VRQHSAEYFDDTIKGPSATPSLRLLAFLIDVVAVCLFGIVIALIVVSWGLCETDFLYYFIETLGREAVASLQKMAQDFLNDVSETSLTAVVVGFAILLVFITTYIASSGQTIGMLFTGLSFTSRDGGRREAPLGLGQTVLTLLFNAVLLPGAAYAAFDADGRTLGDIAAGAEVVRTKSLRTSSNPFILTRALTDWSSPTKTSTSSTPRRAAGSIAAAVHKPLHQKKWQDLGFLLFFVASSLGFWWSKNMFFARNFGETSNISLNDGIHRFISTTLGGVDVFVKEHFAASVFIAASAFCTLAAVLLVLRFFAVLFLWAGIAAFLSTSAFFVYINITTHDLVHAIIWTGVFAVQCSIVAYFYPSLKLTCEIWREAVKAVTAHPALTFAVPVLEFGLQLYQGWLFSWWLCLWSVSWGVSVAEQDEARMLCAWASLQQWMVFFTIRAAFEMAIGGTVAKYYFRSTDGSEEGFAHGIGRALSSLTAAFTKSLGSAVFAGIILYAAACVRRVHSWVAAAYGKMVWYSIWLPLKLVFWIWRFALAVIYHWLQNFALVTCTFCGMYGVSLVEAGEMTTRLFARGGLWNVLIANDWSSIMSVVVLNLSAWAMFWTLPNVLKLASMVTGDDGVANALIPAMVICVSVAISMLWSLSGATRAVLVCAAEERLRGEQSAASPALKAAIKAL